MDFKGTLQLQQATEIGPFEFRVSRGWSDPPTSLKWHWILLKWVPFGHKTLPNKRRDTEGFLKAYSGYKRKFIHRV